MKRKLAAVLTAAVCAVTLLGGCGNDTVSTSSGSVSTSGGNTVSSDQTAGNTKDNSSSSDTIKFSELFKNDVYVYRTGATELTKETFISSITLYRTDGTYENIYDGVVSGQLGDIAQIDDEDAYFQDLLERHEKAIANAAASGGTIIYSGHESTGKYKLGIVTDGTGNNTESMEVGKISIEFFYGHITIYNASFMVFGNNINNHTTYYIIRDTDETKDKQVVFDEVGTEGILIDASTSELVQEDDNEEKAQQGQNAEYGTEMPENETSQSTEFSTELPGNSVSDTE